MMLHTKYQCSRPCGFREEDSQNNILLLKFVNKSFFTIEIRDYVLSVVSTLVFIFLCIQRTSSNIAYSVQNYQSKQKKSMFDRPLDSGYNTPGPK